MNEIMIKMLGNNGFLYATWIAGGVGCLIQLTLSWIYHRHLGASDRIRSTKNKWFRQLRNRYESGNERNNRVKNIELLVERYLGRRKLLGLYLNTWEELSRMMIPISLMFATIGAALGYAKGNDLTIVLLDLAEGVMIAMLLRLLSAATNLKEKHCILRTNLLDYFENAMQWDKEEQLETAENYERYSGLHRQKEELACTEGNEERNENEVQPDTKTNSKPAADTKQAVKVHREKAAKASRVAKQSERMRRRADRQETRLLRKTEREEARMLRKKQKEQHRMDELARRMEKMQQRIGGASTPQYKTVHSVDGLPKGEMARLKREQLKKKVEVNPLEEDQILSDVLKEFLA